MQSEGSFGNNLLFFLESRRGQKCFFYHVELQACFQHCDVRQEILYIDKNNQLISTGGFYLKVSTGTSIDEQWEHVENTQREHGSECTDQKIDSTSIFTVHHLCRFGSSLRGCAGCERAQTWKTFVHLASYFCGASPPCYLPNKHVFHPCKFSKRCTGTNCGSHWQHYAFTVKAVHCFHN